MSFFDHYKWVFFHPSEPIYKDIYRGSFTPFTTGTLPKTNIAPENGWLEYEISYWGRPISRGYVSFRERRGPSSSKNPPHYIRTPHRFGLPVWPPATRRRRCAICPKKTGLGFRMGSVTNSFHSMRLVNIVKDSIFPISSICRFTFKPLRNQTRNRNQNHLQ